MITSCRGRKHGASLRSKEGHRKRGGEGRKGSEGGRLTEEGEEKERSKLCRKFYSLFHFIISPSIFMTSVQLLAIDHKNSCLNV